MSRSTASRRPLALEESGAWLVLQGSSARGDELGILRGAPGPWKTIAGRDGLRRVFEVPSPTGFRASQAGEVREEIRRWAEDTREGGLPEDWCPPSREEVDGWHSASDRIVHAGADPVRGTIALEPTRFTVVFTLVRRPPPDLAPGRAAWLRRLLVDAQSRWRFVRFRYAPDDEGVRVEVDLSGAPPDHTEFLFRTALGSLRWVARWIQPSISALLDPALVSEVLLRTADEPHAKEA